jgi:hypothetical protein
MTSNSFSIGACNGFTNVNATNPTPSITISVAIHPTAVVSSSNNINNPTSSQLQSVIEVLKANEIKQNEAKKRQKTLFSSGFAIVRKEDKDDELERQWERELKVPLPHKVVGLPKRPVGRPRNNSKQLKDHDDSDSDCVMSSESNDKKAMTVNETTGEMHYSSGLKHQNWCSKPELLSVVHNTVVKHQYNFRDAVAELHRNGVDPKLNPFARLCHSTVQYWYTRPSSLEQWRMKGEFWKHVQAFTSFANENAGEKPIFYGYEGLEKEIIASIEFQRECGIPMNSRTLQSLIRGLLLFRKFPELVENGGTFKCSRSWVRKWLYNAMKFTYKRATKAAQHLPSDHAKQVEFMIARIALLSNLYKIPPALVINCDQTGIHLIPKSNYTYEKEGSTEVGIVGQADKRQITAVAAVSASNIILPFQLIYAGEPGLEGAFPHEDIVDELRDAGFDIRQTKSHWSSELTTEQYIENIIVPYIEQRKKEITTLTVKQKKEQKSILLVDVWHRGKEFRAYMAKEHPDIKLVYVPGGCTSIAQPCDVFLQRPLKYSVLTKYENWATKEIIQQMADGKQPNEVKLDLSLNTIRDNGATWILQSFNELNNPESAYSKSFAKGWIKCGIMKAFDPQYRLECVNKYKGWDCNEVFVPFKKNRFLSDLEWAAIEAEAEGKDGEDDDFEDEEDLDSEQLAAKIVEEQNPIGLSDHELVLNLSLDPNNNHQNNNDPPAIQSDRITRSSNIHYQ